jgi:signal transduction histidine kinase
MLNKAKKLNLELLQSAQEKERAQEHELEMSQRLTQSEKMAALGQLAAGVAHEINNPIAYVSSNLSTLKKYFDIFNGLIAELSGLTSLKTSSAISKEEVASKSSALIQNANYDFLKTDVFSILDESQEGIVRVKNICDRFEEFLSPRRIF